MRIAHAEIACFRALEAVSVPLNQFSVLIGENDVGKTSFLYALDRFFANKKLDDKADWFKQAPETDIRIVLTFQALPEDQQLQALRRADGSVVVSKVFALERPPVVKAKHGKDRHNDFKKVMDEHGAGSSIEYLKGLLGRAGTRMLQEHGEKVDPELAGIFGAVKAVVG